MNILKSILTAFTKKENKGVTVHWVARIDGSVVRGQTVYHEEPTPNLALLKHKMNNPTHLAFATYFENDTF